MRIFNVFILLLLCTNTYAGKLIFSNNNEEVDITGDVTIDNQQGNVTVTTAGGDFLIVGDDQPVILGFYPDDYEIANGESIQANWTVVNADTCDAASTPVGSSSWSGSKTSIDGNHSEFGISVNALPSTLSLTCLNSTGSVTKSFDIVAQPVTSNGNPSIDAFTVNGQGTFVTVSGENNLAQFVWSASDVSSCTASASPALTGWSGTKAVSGSQNITITRDTVVTLACDNVTPRNVTINYSDVVDPSCAGVTVPSLSPNKVELTYADSYGFPFGTQTGGKVKEQWRVDQFLTLSDVYTNSNNFTRRLDFVPAPTDLNQAKVVSYSLSECPGDFSASTVCSGAFSGSATYQINFSTRAADLGNPSICNLEVGKSYYLNFVHDINPNDGNGTPPSCADPSDDRCAINATEIANN